MVFAYCILMIVISTISADQDTGIFFEYDRPEQLYEFLEDMARSHPDIATLKTLGMTRENRPIICLRIHKGPQRRRKIILEFGCHAREWVSHASATHVIIELLTNKKYDNLITSIAWYIIPLLNPDGFHFSKIRVENRYWRKNRSPNPGGCFGVDVNRNYPGPSRRGRYDDSRDYCSEQYGGPQPFSEAETKAIDYLFSLTSRVDAYISTHSNLQAIVLPYAYTRYRPAGYRRLYDVAQKMINAMEKVGYPKYNIIQAGDVYQVDGTVFDWVYDAKRVPLVFTLELPFNDQIHAPFCSNTTEKRMIAKQCIAALEACGLEVMLSRYRSSERKEDKSPNSGHILPNTGTIRMSVKSIAAMSLYITKFIV